MLLTDCGIEQLDSWRARISARFSEIVLGHPGERPDSVYPRWENNAPELDLRPAQRPQVHDLLRFRSQLRGLSEDGELNGREQRARVLALRGLSQARDGEYERAQTSFASAARLDPRLDLALLPTFWSLPRRAHEVAIAALHDANRTRDAAALTATMRSRFRPRAVRAINRQDMVNGD